MTFTWLVFFIQAMISSIFLSVYKIESISIIMVVITSLFFLFDISKRDFPKDIFVILFLSYLLRLFFLFFDLYGRAYYVLPNSGFDSEMFHEAAVHGLLTGDFGRGHIYSYFIGGLYSLFGNDRIISQFINVLLSMHGILLVFDTLKLFKVKATANYIALAVIAILPNFAILSSLLLRESLIIFLCILSFYCFSNWLIKNNVLMLIFAYVLGLLLAAFHSGLIFLVIAYSVVLILYDKQKSQFNFNIKSILVSFIFTLVFLFIFQNYYDVFFAKFSNISEINDVTDIYVSGGSGYSVGLAIGNPVLNFVVNTPLRIIYFVFSPLPWDWRGPTDLFAFFFSSMFYGYTLYLGFQTLGQEKIENKNFIVFMLLIICIGLLVFSWGVSNAGTALRHRDKFIGLFTILFGLVIHSKDLKKVRI